RGGDRGAIARIAALKKVFGDLEAIRQLSFDVADGEFLSVLGPSGCGKSTLLMMIAGLIDPSAGEIRIKDAKVAGPRRELGVVFQSPVLLPWRTVLQNVLFPIELLNLHRPLPAARDGLAAHGEDRRIFRPVAAPAVGRHAATRRNLSGARAR